MFALIKFPTSQKIHTYVASEKIIAKNDGILNFLKRLLSPKIANENKRATINGIINDAPMCNT